MTRPVGDVTPTAGAPLADLLAQLGITPAPSVEARRAARRRARQPRTTEET